MVPAIFVAHGSPMVAIEQSEYGSFLDQLGDRLERPRAVVIFSAHGESSVRMVSQIEEYDIIYDFGGFPDELYQVKYPARGDKSLSQKIQRLLEEEGIACQAEEQRGLDHGSWTILNRIYPKADIPVIAMSVNPDLAPEEQYRIGQALSSLREEGVLIIGSGVTVHNFQLFPVRRDPQIQAAVREFERWIEDRLLAWDTAALFDYEALAPHAHLAVPVNAREHFVPLFYSMGAAGGQPAVKTLHQSWMYDVMVNSVYQMNE